MSGVHPSRILIHFATLSSRKPEPMCLTTNRSVISIHFGKQMPYLANKLFHTPQRKTVGLERVNGLSRWSFHPLNQNWSFESHPEIKLSFSSVQAVPTLLSGSDRQRDLWHSDHGITFGVQGQPPPGLISFSSLCSVY